MKTLKQLLMKKKYWELKESIRMLNIQKINAEKSSFDCVNEAIKHNEIINNNLRYKYV